jgi:hypothetical protein
MHFALHQGSDLALDSFTSSCAMGWKTGATLPNIPMTFADLEKLATRYSPEQTAKWTGFQRKT